MEFESYAPKDIVFKANAAAGSVLLLNDRFDPNWKVTVDGKPETLLHCNYLMRGVYVPAGAHTVEFKFQPPMNTFYVSLVAVCTGLLLCGLLVVVKDPGPEAPDVAAETPDYSARGLHGHRTTGLQEPENVTKDREKRAREAAARNG